MTAKAVKSPKSARKLSGFDRERLASRQHRPRILEYVADNLYKGLDRNQVIQNLLANPKFPEAEKPSIRASIAKTLGRLIHDGTLMENLSIGDRPKPASNSSHSRSRGYVAVTVNPASIRKARDSRDLNKGASKDLVSQDEVIQWIAKHTTDWDPNGAVRDLPRYESRPVDSGKPDIRWPREIILLDIAITHSAAWDILVSVSFRVADNFMKYVREVVQMAPHVTGTQTMFVAQSLDRSMVSQSRNELSV